MPNVFLTNIIIKDILGCKEFASTSIGMAYHRKYCAAVYLNLPATACACYSRSLISKSHTQTIKIYEIQRSLYYKSPSTRPKWYYSPGGGETLHIQWRVPGEQSIEEPLIYKIPQQELYEHRFKNIFAIWLTENIPNPIPNLCFHIPYMRLHPN